MYVHLGQETVVLLRDIIAVLDLESSTTMAKSTKDFLKCAEDEGFVKNVSYDIPRSVVVCDSGGQSVMYITNISPKVLCRNMTKSTPSTVRKQ